MATAKGTQIPLLFEKGRHEERIPEGVLSWENRAGKIRVGELSQKGVMVEQTVEGGGQWHEVKICERHTTLGTQELARGRQSMPGHQLH